MSAEVFGIVRDKLPEIAADYVDYLYKIGNAKRATDYVDLFLYYELQRDYIIHGVLDGDPNNIFGPNISKAIKEQFNKHSLNITRLLGEAMEKLPIYKDLAKEYSNLEFLRDDKGRFTDIVNGWYQNSRGELYHYDGVVWDNVPSEKVSDLEFLGK